MAYSEKDKIIVLRTIRFSESDLVVHGINSVGRRINLLAKGALKSKKRFGGGVLQATHYIEIVYKAKKDSDEERLHFLEDARLLEDFSGLRKDYGRLEAALYFLQIISKVSQEGGFEDASTFDLLGHSLRAASESDNLPTLRLLFEIKFLKAQGVLPPDFPIPPEIQWPLREHRNIHWDVKVTNQLKSRVNLILSQYLG